MEERRLPAGFSAMGLAVIAAAFAATFAFTGAIIVVYETDYWVVVAVAVAASAF